MMTMHIPKLKHNDLQILKYYIVLINGHGAKYITFA